MTAYDLDHLLAELDDKGEPVTLFGKVWTLPADVDAETMLRVQRLQMAIVLARKQGRELNPDDVVDDNVTLDELVERMAGSENFAAWKAEKKADGTPALGYKALQVIAGKLYAIHSGEDEAGKALSGGQGKRTRTSTGTGQRKPRQT